jgi:crotonobetainyl-CoA:carnitine CoA-transferase CaiB-like acyl-CoA transferase
MPSPQSERCAAPDKAGTGHSICAPGAMLARAGRRQHRAMPDSRAEPRALAGLKVLDFSIMLAGPYGARLLADLGADVVKVEPPEGDDMRLRQPLRAAPDGQRHSAYFGQLNAGKRSVVLDLKRTEDLDLARRLALEADVVLENFRPGVMDRLGLGAGALRAANPKLVYCAISGYGQQGPAAGRAAYAMIVQAASGYERTLMRYAGDRARPAPTATFVADLLGGLYAFGAIQAALVQRARTGVGQVVDVALMDSMLNLLIYELQEAQFPVTSARPTYGPVSAADGDVLIVPITERNFVALAEVTVLPALRCDPRFATLPSRSAHWTEMMSVVEQWTKPRRVADVLAALEGAGVPCARYADPGDTLADEQARARGVFAPVHDAAGRFTGVNAPWQMSAGGAAIGARVPGVGEHTTEVLFDWLGIEG